MRHDLLRAREHLTDRAHERLAAAFRADWWDELSCAWTLKETLRDLYASADRAAAEAALADWHTHAEDNRTPVAPQNAENPNAGMSAADVRRLKEFEAENARLKKLLAEAELDEAMLKELPEGKW